MQGEGSALTFTHLCQGWLSQGQAETLHHQLEGCTAALEQELSLVNILLSLAGDSDEPSQLPWKFQGTGKVWDGGLDFILIIHL